MTGIARAPATVSPTPSPSPAPGQPTPERIFMALSAHKRTAALWAAIVELVPDESRVAPPIPAAFGLKMLASTPGGDAYTYAELDRMCLEAGFKATDLKPLAPTLQSLVIAQR